MKRKATLEKIYKLALTLINEKTYTSENYNKCFSLANDFNKINNEFDEIFVCEIENGIMIEDETFYFED